MTIILDSPEKIRRECPVETEIFGISIWLMETEALTGMKWIAVHATRIVQLG